MTSLLSARWHRVADLVPQLAPHVQVRRQRVRGTTWTLLAEPGGGRSVRLNPAAYAIAGRFDGRCTVQQLWDGLLAQDTDPPTQDELIDLLARLREAALVQFDRAADFDLLLPHLDSVARPRGRGSLLAWRLPLGDPSALLDRLRPVQRALFSRAAFAIWGFAVIVLAVLALQHAPSLWAHAVQSLATPRFALLAALLYLPTKALHELAHGLAVQRWGGPVREAGVTWMLLMPVPYVDASAASAFARRRQRIVVSAAGIMAELGLASVALPLWLWLDDGLARDAAFVTLAITGVSTLLFNANPLQRLDGYYILGDALGLPNLGPRSRQWWFGLLMRRVLHLPGIEAMPVARGETPWLAAYAPLSWACGVVLAALAVAWIGQLSLALGLLGGLLLAWQLLLRPLAHLIGQLRRAAIAQQGTARRWRRLALGTGGALVLLLLLPLPQRTLVQGVVWPADQAQLRAEEDGFVSALAATPGEAVRAGQIVVQLANPALQAQLERQSARVAALETMVFDALPGDGARAADARADLGAAQAELERLSDRVEALAVRAQTAGRVALTDANGLAGRFVRHGSLLGQVLTDAPPTVRVALPESDARALRTADDATRVRLAASAQTAHVATLLRDSGGAVAQLPSAALSTRHGGAVATDPRDADDLKPLQPVVVLDLRLDASAATDDGRIGERAWVRFDAGAAPLVMQLARGLRRQVLRRFNPQF